MSLFSSLHPFFSFLLKQTSIIVYLLKFLKYTALFWMLLTVQVFLPKDRRSSLALWGNLRSWWRRGEVIYKSKPNDTKQYELKLCLHVQWANWTHFQPDLWSLAPESWSPWCSALTDTQWGTSPCWGKPCEGRLFVTKQIYFRKKERQERDLLCK